VHQPQIARYPRHFQHCDHGKPSFRMDGWRFFVRCDIAPGGVTPRLSGEGRAVKNCVKSDIFCAPEGMKGHLPFMPLDGSRRINYL